MQIPKTEGTDLASAFVGRQEGDTNLISVMLDDSDEVLSAALKRHHPIPRNAVRMRQEEGTG